MAAGIQAQNLWKKQPVHLTIPPAPCGLFFWDKVSSYSPGQPDAGYVA